MPDSGLTYLIADIGGTHTRLAVSDGEARIERVEVFENSDFPELSAAFRVYLDSLPADGRPQAGVIAVACPVLGDRITFTNRVEWNFSVREYCSMFSFRFLHVINDFAAVAMSIPLLSADDYLKIGNGEPVAGKPVAVIGPGTGLGVSLLVPVQGKWIPVSTEGGHATLAARTAEEAQLIGIVRANYDHVSAERLLSGPGLSLIYQAITELQGQPAAAPAAAEVTRRDQAGTDPVASRTIDVFMEMLGTVAGNLALTSGAQGGVYVAGGILPRGSRRFAESGFRKRFIDKGRYRDYLDHIPTYLITKDNVALTGLASYIKALKA